MNHRQRYALARDQLGMTVEEYERALNLPPFTVYPGVRRATRGQRGFAMYAPGVRERVQLEEAKAMATMRDQGRTYREIAKQFDTTVSLVHRRLTSPRHNHIEAQDEKPCADRDPDDAPVSGDRLARQGSDTTELHARQG